MKNTTQRLLIVYNAFLTWTKLEKHNNFAYVVQDNYVLIVHKLIKTRKLTLSFVVLFCFAFCLYFVVDFVVIICCIILLFWRYHILLSTLFQKYVVLILIMLLSLSSNNVVKMHSSSEIFYHMHISLVKLIAGRKKAERGQMFFLSFCWIAQLSSWKRLLTWADNGMEVIRLAKFYAKV